MAQMSRTFFDKLLVFGELETSPTDKARGPDAIETSAAGISNCTVSTNNPTSKRTMSRPKRSEVERSAFLFPDSKR